MYKQNRFIVDGGRYKTKIDHIESKIKLGGENRWRFENKNKHNVFIGWVGGWVGVIKLV